MVKGIYIKVHTCFRNLAPDLNFQNVFSKLMKGKERNSIPMSLILISI